MSEPYKAPDSEAGGDADFDPSAAVPSILVRIAGGSLVVAGCFVAASGAQLWTFFTLYELWVKVMATLMVLAGGAALPIGGFHFQARGWAAFLAMALSAFLALLSTGWLFYAIYSGLFSPIMVFASASSALAALLVLVSVPSALKASAARAALYR